MPLRERYSVRGIGVAVSVRTSIDALSRLRRSLCFTPKRCSSSTIRSPRSLKTTSSERRRCVPTTTSTAPSASAARRSRWSLAPRKRPERPDLHGVVGEPLLEGVPVLLDEDRRGGKHRDLLAVLDRLEGRPDRDLGLAVPDISADEAVHRPLPLHVPLDVLRGRALIRGVLVEERGLHLQLPPRVRRERVPDRRLAPGVQLQQLGRHLLDRVLGLPAERLPSLPTDAVYARGLGVVGLSYPALHQVEPRDRETQDLTTAVLDGQRLQLLSADVDMLQPREAPHPVIHVDDVVAGGQLGEALQRDRASEAAGSANAAGAPEDLVIVEGPAEGGGSLRARSPPRGIRVPGVCRPGDVARHRESPRGVRAGPDCRRGGASQPRWRLLRGGRTPVAPCPARWGEPQTHAGGSRAPRRRSARAGAARRAGHSVDRAPRRARPADGVPLRTPSGSRRGRSPATTSAPPRRRRSTHRAGR